MIEIKAGVLPVPDHWPRKEVGLARHFDAIVVGSGLGGLTAAALCTRAGRRVLVLERNETAGGAATVYRHGGLTIEASLHEIDGMDEADPKLPILRRLGLDRDLTFVDVGDFYEVRGRAIGRPFVVPHGIEQVTAAAAARFPNRAKGLQAYFRRLVAVRHAVSTAVFHQDDRAWWTHNGFQAARVLWPLVRERRATVGQVLSRCFGSDEVIKLILAANLSYYHDDPDRMSFVGYAIPQASYHVGGGHYIRGGSQALSARLATLIQDKGGLVECGRHASRLLLDGARVRGVTHHASGGDDARDDLAPVVFGNAAPSQLAAMLPDSARRSFLARYAARRPSISLWTISLGLTRAPRAFGIERYSTFILPDWLRHLGEFREAAAVMSDADGARLPPYVLVDYGQIDSGLNPDGPYFASLSGVDRLENWTGLTAEEKERRKHRWMDRIVRDVDREFPGFAAAVAHREMATAETMQHFLNTPGGGIYGFAPEGRAGPFHVAARTAIPGLFLASAYTLGGGYTGAIMGGALAARAALRDAATSSRPAWR